MREITGARELAGVLRSYANGAERLTMTQACKATGLTSKTIIKFKSVHQAGKNKHCYFLATELAKELLKG